MSGRVMTVISFMLVTATLVPLAGCRSAEPTDQPARLEPVSTAPALSKPVGIIVDIDETISVTDYPSLIFGIGTDESRPYAHAREVLTDLSQHFNIAYVTARPQWLSGHTRKWLIDKGFPPGMVLTTARMVDVFWPGSFKKRSTAALRRTSPNLLIGIGDRQTDVEAYVANVMLALVVNPRRKVVYHEQAEVLSDWRKVAAFFDEHAATLRDPNALRARYGLSAAPLDPATVRTRPEYDLALLVEIPLLGPTILIESIVKINTAHEQAQARKALKLAQVPFAEALRRIEQRFGGDNLLKVRLATEHNAVVYVVTFLQENKVYKTRLDADLEVAKEAKQVVILVKNSVEARKQARLTFAEALARSLREVEGQVYEIELEMDDDRATYEIALMAGGRFMEVEVDAQSGEVLEVEDETAIQ